MEVFTLKKKIVWGSVFVGFVFTIPFILQVFIFDNIVFSTVSNDGWAGFLGGYIGAIIGALTTLLGITLQINDNNKTRAAEEIKNIRPFLYLRVDTLENKGDYTKVVGKMKNIGMNSACDIYIYDVGLGEIGHKNPWTNHNAISVSEEVIIEKEFNFNSTVIYEFIYYDLKGNRYRQEFRFDIDNLAFFSLEPVLERVSLGARHN